MIEPIYTAKDICEMFGFKDARTARKIMREEMTHNEKPVLHVTERSLKTWMEKNTLPPANEMRRIIRRKGA